ncbi:hypothetical protein D3C75_857970 [compost metagenome]
MLPCLGKRAVSIANRLALDALVPLMVLHLAFDLIHQLAIVGAGGVAQVVTLDSGESSRVFGQVNYLLQLALAEGALAM